MPAALTLRVGGAVAAGDRAIAITIRGVRKSIRDDLQGLIPNLPKGTRLENNTAFAEGNDSIAIIAPDTLTTEQWTAILTPIRSFRADAEFLREVNGLPRPVESIFLQLIKEAVSSQVNAIYNIWDIAPHFTGRKKNLQNVRDALQQYHYVVVSGLPGVGKTQLVRYYAEVNQEYYFGLVHLIIAESVIDLESAFKSLAKTLNIEIETRSSLEIVRHVYQKLRKMPRVLLIFDNARDYDTIEKYLPNDEVCQNVDILITSRTQIAGEWTKFSALEPVENFERSESIAYLNNELNKERWKDINPSRSSLIALAESLNDFPLALAQAVHYIKEVNKQIRRSNEKTQDPNKKTSPFTVRNYLSALKRIPEKLYDVSPDLEGAYGKGGQGTLYKVWQITAEDIRKKSPFALHILRCSAFLAADNIPLALFKDYADESTLRDTFSLLKDYALIYIHGERECFFKGVFSIHRMFRRIIKIHIDNEAKNLSLKTVFMGRESYDRLYISLIISKAKNFLNLNSLELGDRRTDTELLQKLANFMPHVSELMNHFPLQNQKNIDFPSRIFQVFNFSIKPELSHFVLNLFLSTIYKFYFVFTGKGRFLFADGFANSLLYVINRHFTKINFNHIEQFIYTRYHPLYSRISLVAPYSQLWRPETSVVYMLPYFLLHVFLDWYGQTQLSGMGNAVISLFMLMYVVYNLHKKGLIPNAKTFSIKFCFASVGNELSNAIFIIFLSYMIPASFSNDNIIKHLIEVFMLLYSMGILFFIADSISFHGKKVWTERHVIMNSMKNISSLKKKNFIFYKFFLIFVLMSMIKNAPLSKTGLLMVSGIIAAIPAFINAYPVYEQWVFSVVYIITAITYYVQKIPTIGYQEKFILWQFTASVYRFGELSLLENNVKIAEILLATARKVYNQHFVNENFKLVNFEYDPLYQKVCKILLSGVDASERSAISQILADSSQAPEVKIRNLQQLLNQKSIDFSVLLEERAAAGTPITPAIDEVPVSPGSISELGEHSVLSGYFARGYQRTEGNVEVNVSAALKNQSTSHSNPLPTVVSARA